VYIDDVFTFSHYPKGIMLDIAGKFDIKNDEIEEPKLYLCSNIEIEKF